MATTCETGSGFRFTLLQDDVLSDHVQAPLFRPKLGVADGPVYAQEVFCASDKPYGVDTLESCVTKSSELGVHGTLMP